MARIARQLTDLVGNTPLLEFSNFNASKGLKAQVIGKLEYFNPAGSVKDRIALAMIENAEAKGLLKPGATIIEPTSGNTGVGLAFVSASKGYKLILTMPDTMSVERRNILKAYGAELVLTEGAKGMKGAIAKAEELEKSIPGAVILGQFDNPANPAAHAATTGPARASAPSSPPQRTCAISPVFRYASSTSFSRSGSQRMPLWRTGSFKNAGIRSSARL